MQLMLNSPVALTILVITLITTFKGFSDPTFRARLLFSPYQMVHNKQTYRLFSSALIHADYMHIAFNGLTFYFFAFHLEALIGHWQFALLYVGAQMISGIPDIIRHKDNISYHSLGASGAISGVLFAFILAYPTHKLNFLFIPIDIPAWFIGIAFLGYSLYASFFSRKMQKINHDAHFWGAIGGIVMLPILKPEVARNFHHWILSLI